MPPPTMITPEAILGRAEELVAIGQLFTASAVLHEYLGSNEALNAPAISLKPLVLLSSSLADLKSRRKAQPNTVDRTQSHSHHFSGHALSQSNQDTHQLMESDNSLAMKHSNPETLREVSSKGVKSHESEGPHILDDVPNAFDEMMQVDHATTSTSAGQWRPPGSEQNQDQTKLSLDDMPREILLAILDQLIPETVEIRSTYDCGKWQVQYLHMPFPELCLVSKTIASATRQVMCARRPTLRLDIPPTFLGFDQTLGFGPMGFNHLIPPLLRIPEYLASEVRLRNLQEQICRTLSKIERDRYDWPRLYPWAYISMAISWDGYDNVICSKECWVWIIAISKRIIEERERERRERERREIERLRELARNSIETLPDVD
ncbi:uncharacterized protein AB675_4573 [Cyphellophora attinorum]|uniref:F-box domain-containing protein n=1 Tax=Cyphellophora attinorum TaxID=1664694 RepID=A0A0N1H9S9_9EURO|nr:uncharacterized protein AB675_4573 [Phialophora attinorum]KPI39033.1 hypothetical protein AB675_4573 [Phialophora attinorum]